jgi:hypothetical protein
MLIDVDGTPDYLRRLLQQTLDLYCFGHRAKEYIKSSPSVEGLQNSNGLSDEERKLRVEAKNEAEKIIDSLIELGAEDWIAGIEDDFLAFLEQLRGGKTAFYDVAATAMPFIFGLCVQFSRTKQVREAALRAMGPEIQGRRTLHMMSAMQHLMAIRISHSLNADRKSFKVEVIENESDTPFIATDQPLINLHGDADPTSPAPERLEFFYPLSPKRAMVFLEKDTFIPLRLSGIAVNNYNVIMAQHSHEQIFSNSKEFLESFAKIIGGIGSGNRLRSW